MKKKYLALIMACIMCTSVFVTGCGRTSEVVEADDEDDDDEDDDDRRRDDEEDDDDCECDDDDFDDYDFDDEDDDEELYEVVCPTCGDSLLLDSGMLDEGSMACPNCGENLEFDLDDLDDDDDLGASVDEDTPENM